MSRIITINTRGLSFLGDIPSRTDKRSAFSGRVLSMREKKVNPRKELHKESSVQGLTTVGFVLIFLVVISGAFYLYQVNDLATKGYEMKEVENRTKELEKENKKMEIREIELRSMYNIEKATENLDLVSPKNISYVEMGSSVAMK